MKEITRLENIPIRSDGALKIASSALPEQETLLPVFIGSSSSRIVRNVTLPTLTAYLPDPAIANGTAIIACPGGAFAFLAIESEGEDVARWFNERGVAVFVLKYRLAPTPARDEDFLQQLMQIVHDEQQMKSQMPFGVMDGKEALRVVRERASEWSIDPQRIGILGFSGGGVIAIAAATQFDAANRPNFVASLYAPIWQELTVPADAPPLFVALANDDPAVTDGNMPLYNAWKAAGHAVELHIYARGGHAFGMIKQGLPSDHWIEQFSEWLQLEGFLS